MTGLPPGLLLGYYGDDFTGSTDSMEALATAGLRTVLFLDPPDPGRLRRYDGLRAVGIAGASRSLPRDAMGAELVPAFEGLRSLAPPLVHYKVCSTLDSSPEIGSIGRAIDLGQELFRSPFVPLVVGAPSLGRYCLFGNLFARSGLESEVYRLDRHPTMRSHPVTPMRESDLRLVLAEQTSKRVGLLDAVDLGGPFAAAGAKLDVLLEAGSEIVLFDVLRDEDLESVGRLVWTRADPAAPLFAAGSSGVEYALTAFWRRSGWLGPPPSLRADPMDRVVVVSGSCSPVTERQIRWAAAHGFEEIALRSERLVDPDEWDDECRASVQVAAALLDRGRSVILHTSRGPADPRIEATVRRLGALGCSGLDARVEAAGRLGSALGCILKAVLERTRVRRAVAIGGDSSSRVARALGIESLEMIAPCAPGSPLCRVHAAHPAIDGVEIVFKGGQVGTEEFMARVVAGGAG